MIYGSGELLNGTSTVIILMLYLKFLTDVVALSPLLAGVCLVAGKLWDAISDPLIGAISDRTRSRFGRRRLFFLLFSVPGSIAFAAMWVKISTGIVWIQVVYYAGIYVAFKTLSTLLNVPYQALGPELTDNYNERTSLVTFRMAFAILGSMVAGIVPNLIVERFSRDGAPELGHLVVALLFGAVYVFVWLLIFFKIKEPPVTAKRPRFKFFRALGLTMRSRSFRMLIGIYLLAFLALDVMTAAAKFYVDEFLCNPRLMPLVMGSMLSSAFLVLPLYLWATARFDRRRTLMGGTGIWIVGLVFLFTLDKGCSPLVLGGVMILIGAGVAAAFVVPWSALPEVIDVDRFVNGRAQEGVFTGVMTFLRKLSTTGALFLLSLTLNWTGYLPPDARVGNSQPESTLLSIHLLTTLVPAFFLITSFFFTWRYPIDRHRYELLRKRLEHTTDDPLTPAEQSKLNQLIKEAY